MPQFPYRYIVILKVRRTTGWWEESMHLNHGEHLESCLAQGGCCLHVCSQYWTFPLSNPTPLKSHFPLLGTLAPSGVPCLLAPSLPLPWCDVGQGSSSLSFLFYKLRQLSDWNSPALPQQLSVCVGMLRVCLSVVHLTPSSPSSWPVSLSSAVPRGQWVPSPHSVWFSHMCSGRIPCPQTSSQSCPF